MNARNLGPPPEDQCYGLDLISRFLLAALIASVVNIDPDNLESRIELSSSHSKNPYYQCPRPRRLSTAGTVSGSSRKQQLSGLMCSCPKRMTGIYLQVDPVN